MRKITDVDVSRMEKGLGQKTWNSGMVLSVDMDWDADTYIISAEEVFAEFEKYVQKWPGKKKFKVKGRISLSLGYTR